VSVVSMKVNFPDMNDTLVVKDTEEEFFEKVNKAK
jgi:hypothetical protein